MTDQPAPTPVSNESIESKPEGAIASAISGAAKPAAAANFYDAFPEEIKSSPTIQKYKTAEELAKAHIEASKLLGTQAENLVKKPTENAKPEEYDAFYKALGRPDKPEDYGIQLPEGGNQEFMTGMTKAMFDAGLSKKQADALAASYNQLTGQILGKTATETAAAIKVETEATLSELQKEWGNGAAFNDRISAAEFAAEQVFSEKTREMIKASPLGRNAEFIKFMALQGMKMRENPMVVGNTTAGGKILTPAEASQALTELRSSKDHQANIMSKDSAIRLAAVDKEKKLFEMAYPEQVVKLG